jgi:hypothetical protein
VRLALFLCAASAAASPRAGRWGEDPTKVPDFAMAEERRAPKMPDGSKWYATLGGEEQVDSLEDALLVCYNEVRQKSNWFWSLTNVQMTLALRKEPPIKLWAAWYHDASYVSIPRVSLKRGDRLAVRFIDGGMFSNKPLGSAERRFDGKLPLVFKLHGIYVECRVMSHDKALQAAGTRLQQIDEALSLYERTPPPDFSRRDGATGIDPDFVLYKLKRDYGGLALRYVAGFVGWEDPVIQELLARMKRDEAQRKELLAQAVVKTAATLPPAGEWVQVARRRLRITRVVCGKEYVERKDECAVLVDIQAEPRDMGALDCRGFRDANLIDAGGESIPLRWTDAVFDGAGQPCRGQAEIVRVPVPYAAGAHPRLLQIFGNAGIILLRVD